VTVEQLQSFLAAESPSASSRASSNFSYEEEMNAILDQQLSSPDSLINQ